MLDGLQTLVCLAQEGTMTRTATVLRLGQSTVSKRIASLEAELGYDVVERHGRRVRLTVRGRQLVDRVAPLLGSLQAAVSDDPRIAAGTLAVGVSESLLASWGAELLQRAQAGVESLRLELHAHRSPVAIDRVRAGEYALALVAGRHERAADLHVVPLLEEEIVIIPSGLQRLRLLRNRMLKAIGIEEHAATWASMRGGLKRLRRERGLRIEVTQRLESFAAIVQMARSGLGHGLVPLGIARALGIPAKAILHLPAPGLSRPVSLLGRPTTFERAPVAAFHASLLACVSRKG